MMGLLKLVDHRGRVHVTVPHFGGSHHIKIRESFLLSHLEFIGGDGVKHRIEVNVSGADRRVLGDGLAWDVRSDLRLRL